MISINWTGRKAGRLGIGVLLWDSKVGRKHSRLLRGRMVFISGFIIGVPWGNGGTSNAS